MNVKFRVVCVFSLSLSLATIVVAGSRVPAKRLAQDPNAPVVELFDAIDHGQVEATVIAKNANSATVFVTNTTKAAVNVQFPRVVTAVPVLKQLGFGQQGMGMGRGGNNGPGGGGGQTQAIGGGIGGQQQGNMGQNGPGGAMNNQGAGFQMGVGNGVFSVPPLKTVQVSLSTVCLAHGKPEPRAKLKYQLVKIEDFSNDPVLQETLNLFVSGATDTETTQAAVWHLTDKMSWDDLNNKQIERLGSTPVAYFGDGKVDAAKDLIQKAQKQAKASPRPVVTANRRPE